MLMELSRREKAAGIKPDPDVDIFMKAISMEGQKTSIVTDYIMKILGLDICTDTLVGDQMRRGISGGQRKRVTTGEMLVGPAKALFMDEISTGLDSSTTFQIVKCLRQTVHVMDATMVVSLLQPQPETFELFDDIIILSEGQIVYQGPREFVLDFFSSMGFKCPERKSIADFLQEVISRKDQAQYWVHESHPYRYIPVKEFSEAFKLYHVGKKLQEELTVPFDKSKSHPAALSTRRYGLAGKALLQACLSREWILMKRNSFLHIFKTCQATLVTIVALTIFLRTELHQTTVADGNLYVGALFFGLILVMFNGFSEMAMVVSRLPVFYKERDQLFYPAWAYSIPVVIIRLPLSLLESLIWVCLTYYTIGFTPEPSRFFRQLLVLFCVSQMASGLFRLLGSVGRSTIIASTFGSFILMIIFILGGFVISKDRIPNWWIWCYWVSPLMYGQNGLVINEFLADRWNKPYSGSVDANTVGIAVLKARGFFTEERWYWISVGVLIGFAIIFNGLFIVAMTYLNPLNKRRTILLHDEETVKKGSKERNKNAEFPSAGWPSEGEDKVNDTFPASNDFIVTGIPSLEQGRGMVLPFQPLSITFNSINYYVNMPLEMKKQGILEDRLQLLKDVTGGFRPGILTALVGVSGAGKTTLLDVLAGRKTTGTIEGDIRISGFPKKQKTFSRISGYCEQNDIHSPNVTVVESLTYSAWLRLPKEVDNRTRMMFVEEVMELIELTSVKDALVGLPGVNGLSSEQRKRLTIAVELVANPSIIFMDEPTSGLDARAAAIVMRTVRNTVNTGRTVVCTIHQPSIDIFESFDELLLLKRGGEVIYAGSLGVNSCKLIEYFQGIPGIQPIKEGYNPAAWMLDVSSPSAETCLNIDFAQIYRNSSLFLENKARVEELSVPLSGSKELSFSTKYSQSYFEQFLACLWKQHWSYWRNPDYNAVRLLFTFAIGILFGTVFWNLGQNLKTVQDVFNLIGATFSATLFLGFTNANTVEPVVGIERTVFYRERGAGMYSELPYAFAQAAIEVPYIFIQTLIYVFLVFSMIKFQWAAVNFLYFFFFMFFTFLFFTYYGMMCVAITPNVYFAAIISSAFFTFWNLFSGFIIPRKSIPVWWRWYCWADPIQWSIYGLITSQLGEIGSPIKNPDIVGGYQSVKDFLKDNLGYEHDFLGFVAVIHLGFTAIFLFVFFYSIKKINFQKR
ncbi:hypothetical protein KP509_04G041200 [Ceratopteris richardii]|nr:hypothetical protein KP509_04G041200 [Ceratopteris richardii]